MVQVAHRIYSRVHERIEQLDPLLPEIDGIGGSCTAALELRGDLAVYHRAVTTTSKDAQRWFDQGLVLYFGFNHDAAIGSFKKAAELDPTCAMAYWGQALAAGPHINNLEMDEAAAKAAGAPAARIASSASARARFMESSVS